MDIIIENAEISLMTRVLGVLDSPSKIPAFNGLVRPKRSLYSAERNSCSGSSIGLFATGMPAASGMGLISLPQIHVCVLNEGGCFTSVH